MIYECLRARRVCVESPKTKKYKLANWIKNNIIQSEKAIVNEKLNMRQDTACSALTSKKVEPNSSPVLPQQGPSRRPLSSPESDSIFDTFVYPSSSETPAAFDKRPKPKTPKTRHSTKKLYFQTKLNASEPMGPDVSQVHLSTKDSQNELKAVKGKNPYYQKEFGD